jgi:hypothetical protein
MQFCSPLAPSVLNIDNFLVYCSVAALAVTWWELNQSARISLCCQYLTHSLAGGLFPNLIAEARGVELRTVRRGKIWSFNATGRVRMSLRRLALPPSSGSCVVRDGKCHWNKFTHYWFLTRLHLSTLQTTAPKFIIILSIILVYKLLRSTLTGL